MKYKIVKAKSREEAIEKSGLRIGQLARIVNLMVSGNNEGQYTVAPEFELVEEEETK